MEITLNLASRPYVDLRVVYKRLRVAILALALVAIALGAALYLIQGRAHEAYVRVHSLDAVSAGLITEMRGYESIMLRPDNAKVVDETEALNQLFDEKAFSWTEVMQNLETILPGAVQLTAIEPVRTKDGHVTLRIHVVGPRDRTIELLQNLEHSTRFGSPRILGESPQAEGLGTDKQAPLTPSSMEEVDLLTEYDVEAAKARAEQAAQSGPQLSAVVSASCNSCASQVLGSASSTSKPKPLRISNAGGMK